MSAAVQQRRFTNYDFGFQIRRTLRLSLVMALLGKSEFMSPLPTRRNITDLLEEGVIEGRLTDYGWIVYEDSFLAWLKQFSDPIAP